MVALHCRECSEEFLLGHVNAEHPDTCGRCVTTIGKSIPEIIALLVRGHNINVAYALKSPYRPLRNVYHAAWFTDNWQPSKEHSAKPALNIGVRHLHKRDHPTLMLIS
jgi:hypothetical protein